MRWLVAASVFALFASPVVASAQDGFQSPSGNIFCEPDGETIRCDLVNFTFAKPPRPRDCDTDWGHAYSVGPRGASSVLCAGDTVVNRGARVLRYGARWDSKGVTCFSEQTGMRCINMDGRGFEISRARLNRF